MANTPIHMTKLRHVLKLHFLGRNKLQIAETTRLSRNTVKKYLSALVKLGLSWEQIRDLSDESLQMLFYGEAEQKPDERLLVLHRFLEANNKNLRRVGYTRGHLWRLYQSKHPEGFGMTSFYRHHALWSHRAAPSMHIEHKAGDKVYVDFAGTKLPLLDPATGVVREVEVFVAILGASQLTYVEAVESQRAEDFITCCENALHYFGGSPQAIVPDNLKSAVIKPNRFEPTLNDNFDTFADHYNMTVLPARARKPKDKALVEGAVKITYQRIYAGLPPRPATSLGELNARIGKLLEEHNTTPVTGRSVSRREQFVEIDQEALQPLPAYRYELRRNTVVTVMKNGHVNLREDRRYYSVPYTYISKKVRIIYSRTTVEVYYRYELIASHERARSGPAYVTKKEHLASHHQILTEWNPEYFLQKAAALGDEVKQVVEKILEKPQHLEQSYKSCNGIILCASKVGTERLRKACRRARHFGTYSYRAVEDILARGLDAAEDEEELPAMPLHGNIRGKEYFQQTPLSSSLSENDHDRTDH